MSAIVLGLLVAACGSEATFERQSLALQAGAKTDVIVSARGQIKKGFEAAVAANGDTLRHYYPEAGFAVVTTATPDAYRSFADTVVLDLTVDWLEPQHGLGEEAVGSIDYTDDFFYGLQWGNPTVGAERAWADGATGAGVRVAVLDSGIDCDHPDLTPNLNLALSASAVPGEHVCVRDGYFFNHGTHVAGTIAAADNAMGTVGVAPDAEIVAVKVLSEYTGSGSFGGVIAGILYAAAIDADIINMSLGATLPKHGYTYEDDDGNLVRVNGADIAALTTATNRAIAYAYQGGTTVISSAGNSARDGDHDADTIAFPASAPHALSIAAVGPHSWGMDPTVPTTNPSYYSNYGQSVIDFAAPGGTVDWSKVVRNAEGRIDWANMPVCSQGGITYYCLFFDMVWSTTADGWDWAQGTSMAAPHAAGVAALIIGANGGDMSPAHVERELRARALDLGKPGNDDHYGAGLTYWGH